MEEEINFNLQVFDSWLLLVKRNTFNVPEFPHFSFVLRNLTSSVSGENFWGEKSFRFFQPSTPKCLEEHNEREHQSSKKTAAAELFGIYNFTRCGIRGNNKNFLMNPTANPRRKNRSKNKNENVISLFSTIVVKWIELQFNIRRA